MDKSNTFWKKYNQQLKNKRDDLDKCIISQMSLEQIHKISGIDKDIIIEFAKQSKKSMEKIRAKKNGNFPITKIMEFKHWIQTNS